MAIRLKRDPVYAPHSVFEDLADLHGAVDPDTGHLVCHYFPIAPVIVEAGSSEVPGLQIGECLTLVLGREYTGKILEASRPAGKFNPQEYNSRALGYALSLLRTHAYTIRFMLPQDGDDPLVLHFAPASKRDGEEDLIVMVWKCKRPERQAPVLQV